MYLQFITLLLAAPAQKDAAPQSDADLQREIEQATKPEVRPTTPASGPDLSTYAAKSAGALGFSPAYNPALSVNGLFLGSATSNRHPEAEEISTRLGIQEVELQALANVDPFFTASFILAMDEGEGLEVEEGIVTPSWHPLGLQMRLGKMKVPFGRENPVHTHALPFVNKSLIGNAVFGPEGLAEVGAELSLLFPLPWYMTLTASVLNGDNEGQFASLHQYAMTGLAALRNVFDLTDDTTLEAGLSYAGGKNAADDTNNVFGAHLVLKWRPAARSRDRELVITAEALYATRPNDAAELELTGDDRNLGGGYGYVQWRLEQQWWIGARYDHLGIPSEARGVTRRGTGIIVYAPTEFSAIRLQGGAVLPPHGGEAIWEGLLQLNVTIGAHPAHSY